MALTIRHLPDQLQELSININDALITNEISKLLTEARVVSNNVNKAFSHTGGNVLQQKKELARVFCPSRVEIEKLSKTLLAFKEDLGVCTKGTIALKTNINNFIWVNQCKMKAKENEIKASKIVIDSLDKQIQQTENEIKTYEEEASNEERGAVDLDNRASDLRRQAEDLKEKGWLWGIGSVVVGIVLAPFTLGGSLALGLASAGVGMAINFDSASNCTRAAVRLRVSAEDKRENAERKRKSKAEFESQRSAKTVQLRNCKLEIENLSKTFTGLSRLEMLLTTSLSGFERAIYIAQDFQNEVHRTILAGDSFQLIKEVFIECPEEIHDEAHEEMYKLKLKWIHLEEMLTSKREYQPIAFYVSSRFSLYVLFGCLILFCYLYP